MSSAKAKNSDLKIYLRLLAYLKPFVLFFVFAVVGMGLYAYATAEFVDVLENLLKVIERNNPNDRIAIPLEVLFLTFLRGLGSFIGAYYLSKVAFGIIHRLRTQVFNHITHLPNQVFDKENSNHLTAIITYNINGVTQAATDALKVGLREGAVVIALFYKLITMDWKLTMVFIVIAPIIGIMVSAVGKRLRRLSTKAQTSVGDIAQVSGEMITGIRVVRSFGGESYEQERFEAASQKNYLQNMKIVITSAANGPVIQMFVALAIAILIYIALSFMELKDPAKFVAYMTAVGAILNPVRRLGEIAPMILKGVAAADSVFQLLDRPTEADNGTHQVDRAKGLVEFESVSFAYPEQQGAALDNVSLCVKPGKVVALVGKSGSGKTTLVNLLPRFYEITSGQIKLDGTAVADYRLANLRQQISVVNQQVILFEGTIADNIAYGCKERVSLDEIKRAADLAYATEFIDKLPQGFDTSVGEGGARLSGGQRQRIAIARAILKNAPILILDEATSALDNESERYIQAALDEVMKGRTTFVIAHRLSTIERADTIVVMEQGKILEQGSHNELLQKNGAYTKLHAAQFHDVIAEYSSH